MKKILLLLLSVSTFSTYAQGSCATAIPISGTGLTTVGPITGTYTLACDNLGGELTAGALGNWYSFTPTTNGVVVLDSNLPQNAAPSSDDTRVSVYTGTCANLVCLGGSDDISGTNFLTTFTFNALAGTTYYIQWDNRWSAAGFDFQTTFTAVSCLPVSVINAPTNISTTGITLNWAVASGSPAEYQVEYGPVGFTQGSGTIVTVTTNSLTLTGLTASTPYDYYVRSRCNATTFSSWTALNSFTTAKLCPQVMGFEIVNDLVGWSTLGNGSYGLSANAPTLAQAGNFYWIFNTNATTASNNWLFSAPFSLQANEVVTISFWLRAPSTRSIRLTAGNATTPAAQTSVLFTNAAFLNTSFQQFTATFVAPSAGIYYFGWNDISTAQPVSTMRLDSINFSSVLSTTSFELEGLSVYPNPVNDSFSIKNDKNIAIKQATLSDINGRIVKNINTNSLENISISELNTGIYFLSLSSDSGSTTKKIIKN